MRRRRCETDSTPVAKRARTGQAQEDVRGDSHCVRVDLRRRRPSNRLKLLAITSNLLPPPHCPGYPSSQIESIGRKIVSKRLRMAGNFRRKLRGSRGNRNSITALCIQNGRSLASGDFKGDIFIHKLGKTGETATEDHVFKSNKYVKNLFPWANGIIACQNNNSVKLLHLDEVGRPDVELDLGNASKIVYDQNSQADSLLLMGLRDSPEQSIEIFDVGRTPSGKAFCVNGIRGFGNYLFSLRFAQDERMVLVSPSSGYPCLVDLRMLRPQQNGQDALNSNCNGIVTRFNCSNCIPLVNETFGPCFELHRPSFNVLDTQVFGNGLVLTSDHSDSHRVWSLDGKGRAWFEDKSRDYNVGLHTKLRTVIVGGESKRFYSKTQDQAMINEWHLESLSDHSPIAPEFNYVYTNHLSALALAKQGQILAFGTERGDLLVSEHNISE